MSKEEIDIRLKNILLNITQLQNEKTHTVTQFEDWGYVNFNFGRGFVNLTLNEFSCSLNAEIRITVLENIWDDFSVELNLFQPVHSGGYISEKLVQLDGPITYIFGPSNFLKEGIHYVNFEDKNKNFFNFPISEIGFNQVKEKYTRIYHDLFLPKLKETLDIKFLDSTVNDKIEYLGGSSDDYFLALHGMLFRRMILAKLNGNPLYEDICEWNRGICAKLDLIPEENRNVFQKNFRKVFEIVYERLKNVKPMEDTQLVLNLR
ncbi:MAG TPA: hypothetical protein VK169_21290 [Saprospiraceae bacterium]|nr:hypothetical protein [Saprospiraceae bacterium]